MTIKIQFYTSPQASVAEQSRSRITVPQKMVDKLERVRRKAFAKRHQEARRYKGPAVISCKRQQFNHHKGQTYSNFSPEHLASGGWKDQRSKGDFFTINAIQGVRRPLLRHVVIPAVS